MCFCGWFVLRAALICVGILTWILLLVLFVKGGEEREICATRDFIFLPGCLQVARKQPGSR